MKFNCVSVKAFIYVAIAVLTSFIADLSNHKTFSEFSDIGLTIILINSLLQGLIAYRAYLDQSVARDRISKEKKTSVELLTEHNK